MKDESLQEAYVLLTPINQIIPKVIVMHMRMPHFFFIYVRVDVIIGILHHIHVFSSHKRNP